MAASVTVLLRKADEGVKEIRARYEADLAAQQVSDELLYAIRNVVQDVQSALDWTATAVKNKHYPGSEWRPYFPLATDPHKFSDELEKQIKGLATEHPAIAEAFERHQPYKPNNAALGYLHALAKVNKHQDFTPQTRFERHVIRQRYAEAIEETDDRANFSLRPVPGSTDVRWEPQSQPVAPPEQIVYVDWRFVEPPVSVLGTMEELTSLTRTAVDDIRKEAKL